MKTESQDLIQKMLAKARHYCEMQERLSLSTLGRMIVNDTYFFSRAERTGNCQMSTINKVMAWLDNNGGKTAKTKKDHKGKQISKD